MKKYIPEGTHIDHVAIAVVDIEEALVLYEGILGFELIKRREVKGEFSGMKSAELDAGGFSIVLVQGTDPSSQVCRYIDEYGPGVQHVAIATNNVEDLSKKLSDAGLKFVTSIIRGDGLVQIFTQRGKNCGMMFEFIQRTESKEGFDPANIQQLFEQLESSDSF